METTQFQRDFANDYRGKVLSRWLIVYLIVGLIVYAVIYFLVMSKGFSYTNFPYPEPRQTIQVEGAGNVI